MNAYFKAWKSFVLDNTLWNVLSFFRNLGDGAALAAKLCISRGTLGKSVHYLHLEV